MTYTRDFFEKTKKIRSAVIQITDEKGVVLLTAEKGGITQDTEFIAASITKLYTHTIIFQLIDRGLLTYDTRVAALLGREVEAVPFINQMTVRHLIDQTSGLADYETDKLANGTILMKSILKQDASINYAEVLALTKQIKPKFAPASKRKAYYSNMNAALLGRIAETLAGDSYATLLKKYITQPLGLKHTRLIGDQEDHWPFYEGKNELLRPQYISSIGAAGGIITTNNELMNFITAFMQGELFKKQHINAPTFRPIQWFPVRYGSGMMQLHIPFPSTVPTPDLVGHSGSTGSFAYFVPSCKVFICGTINQTEVKPYSYIYRYLKRARSLQGDGKL